MPDGPPVLRGTSGSIDLREEFKATADEYRRVVRLLQFSWIIGAAFLLLLPTTMYRGYGIAGIALCGAAALMVSLVWLPKLICPGCHEDMDKDGSFAAPGQFCPECGEAAIKKGWLFPKCTACRKTLTRGRGGRDYKIRYCTRCDAHVDDRGL
jgi:hypothetical protein